MQPSARPRALRQPAPSRLTKPAPLNLSSQTQDSKPATTNSTIEPSAKVAQLRPLTAGKDAQSSPSRLPVFGAPRNPRQKADGDNTMEIKRRSMLPQLSPTKIPSAFLGGGNGELARVNGLDGREQWGKASPTRGEFTVVDDASIGLAIDVARTQYEKMGVPSAKDSIGPSGKGNTRLLSKPTAATHLPDGTAPQIPPKDTTRGSRMLPLPRVLPMAAVSRLRGGSSEPREGSSLDPGAKLSTSGQVRALRQPAAPSDLNTPNHIFRHNPPSRESLVAPTTNTSRTRPRSGIFKAGTDFNLDAQPVSSRSAGSAELRLSDDKSDTRRHQETNGTHKRASSIRHARTASTGISKDSDRKVSQLAPSKAHGSSKDLNTVEKSQKPVFSILQQHFTPKKGLKGPTSSGPITVPGRQPNSTPVSPETARLQAELLQLHLLHAPSAEVLHAWQSSAKRKLENKFEHVALKHSSLIVAERKTQEQLNLRTLKELQSDPTIDLGLEELIQVLGKVIPEIVNITGAGGKYTRVVRSFGRWLETTKQIWDARDQTGDAKNGKGELRFAEGLGDCWRVEADNMSRKLGLWLQDLDRVGLGSGASSLALVVGHCQSLVDGMLQELDAMRGIEREVVARESNWIVGNVAALSAEIDAQFAEISVSAKSQQSKHRGIWSLP